MKRLLTMLLVLTMMLSVTGAFAAATDIVILVPNADHGWTGAVLTYAEEKAKEINDGGKYTARVISSSDSANQITQVEDIIDNKSANS
ncbi:MAG: sugar ABC transporter substrate-binding protein, partial [Clostridiales bacterium]|nr:sugar ABC transporter substrate-binding protein [Clostridiales bacterium]